MKASANVDDYIAKYEKWKDGLELIRELLLQLGYVEEIKWGSPSYSMDKQNLVGLLGFKENFGLWFHQGAFLSDPHGLLNNAQEGKTKGMRSLKYSSKNEIDLEILRFYLEETIENHRSGKKIKISRTGKKLVMPELLARALKDEASEQFDTFSTSKQNEYIEYIDTAKREATKLSRIEKIIPMISRGEGLHDKYK